MRRRHLTESQRAHIAAELANLDHGEHKTGKSAGLTQPEAADQMQVSERLVRDAKMVQREAPDLAAKVVRGYLSLLRMVITKFVICKMVRKKCGLDEQNLPLCCITASLRPCASSTTINN